MQKNNINVNNIMWDCDNFSRELIGNADMTTTEGRIKFFEFYLGYLTSDKMLNNNIETSMNAKYSIKTFKDALILNIISTIYMINEYEKDTGVLSYLIDDYIKQGFNSTEILKYAKNIKNRQTLINSINAYYIYMDHNYIYRKDCISNSSKHIKELLRINPYLLSNIKKFNCKMSEEEVIFLKAYMIMRKVLLNSNDPELIPSLVKERIANSFNESEISYMYAIVYEYINYVDEKSIQKRVLLDYLEYDMPKEIFIGQFKNNSNLSQMICNLFCELAFEINERTLFDLRINTLNKGHQKRVKFFNPYYEAEQKQYKLK